MKILASDMVFSSDHQFEQMDVSLNEKSSKRKMGRRSGTLNGIADGTSVIVDRVSISQNQRMEYQSNYNSDVSSQSSVSFLQSEDMVSYEQKSAMEKLIGGVIEKDVIIRHIQRGEDIILKNGDVIQADEGAVPQTSDQSGSQMWEISLKQTDIHFEQEHMSMSSLGQVTTEDGRKIEFSLDMSMDRSFVSRTQEETLVQRWQERINLTDPLVISLDGKAPTLSDARFEFDLDSDGETQMINFVNSGSGFLAFDKNNDQVINDGSELFGPGTGNGFGELAAFDEDQNNWIDENDAVFSQLSVWTRDENGEDQLISLKDTGIGAISLDYAQTLFNMTSSDNSLQGQLKHSGVFLFENGNVGSVSQIDLASSPVETEQVKKDVFIKPVLPEEPEMNLQAGIPRAVVEEASSDPPVNPLKELLDRIKELKEQMGRLYEKMSLTAPENHRRRSGLKRSRSLNIDSSILMTGYKAGPVRSHRRYV